MSSCIVLSPLYGDAAAAVSRISAVGAMPKPESFVVYLVVVPGSSAIPMRIMETDSITSVKLRIQSFGGFFVKSQKLVLDGRELARNECLVGDYGVADGKVLHLVIRLSDACFVAVETPCGKKLGFRVERRRSIGYVKRRITDRGEGFADTEVGDHRLLFDGEELDDDQLVEDICRDGDAVIHLLIFKVSELRCEKESDSELPVERELAEELQLFSRKPPCAFVEHVAAENSEVELPEVIGDLIRAACDGLEKGSAPIMSTEGSGGAYFMQGSSGNDYVAVFKPIDEEPMAENNPRGLPLSVDGEGLKRGTRVGEGAFREVAAYILDRPARSGDGTGFSGVPPTVMARCSHPGFNHPGGGGARRRTRMEENFKTGSLQMFVKNCGSCEDMGPGAFPVEEVHKIAVLDIRLANADRHAGNILICKEEDDGPISLVPIDHGYCLPENFEDCTFEWLYWPQAREPFGPEAVGYIRSLDAEEDIALLGRHGWRLSAEAARTLCICTMLLKKGADRGLSPRDIGRVLCRETLKRESVVEEIVREALDAVLPGTGEAAFMECVSELMDRCLDGMPGGGGGH